MGNLRLKVSELMKKILLEFGDNKIEVEMKKGGLARIETKQPEKEKKDGAKKE